MASALRKSCLPETVQFCNIDRASLTTVISPSLHPNHGRRKVLRGRVRGETKRSSTTV